MKTPRLAYLLKKFPRLSETFILNEILGQERLGHPIHVFSRRTADDEPRHAGMEELRASIETLPHRRSIDPWKALFDGPWVTSEMVARIGRVVESARGWEHPRFPELLSEALYLRARVTELGITHVHTHFATDSAVVAMLLKALGGPGFSLTVHAKDIYRNTVREDLLARIFTEADFVVTVCDANVRHLRGFLGEEPCANLRRLYNGIDLESFEPSRRSGADSGPLHVVSVGRLVPKKGLDVLIDALDYLRVRVPDFKATIVGDGDERQRLQAQIDAAGLSSRVTLAGALDQGAVRDVLASASVICLPCVVGEDGNRDALPTVLLEGLAMGLPAISTPVTGIPEILDEGRAGLLVPEHDARATADALVQLLEDPKRRLVLGKRGRRRAEELFDLEKNARTLHGWLSQSLECETEQCV